MAEQVDLQAHLQLRDSFTDGLRDAISETKRLEAALRDATDGTSRATADDIMLLEKQVGGAHRKVKVLSGAIDELDTEMDQMGRSADRAAGKVDKVGKASGKAKSGFAGMVAFGKGAAGAVTAVAAAAAVTVVGLTKLNTAIGQYEQNINKTKVVFAGQNREMRRWAKNHTDDFGGSTQDVLNYAASLQDLIVPMGFQRKEATGMTKDIAGLVPVLTNWDKAGRSSEEITTILAAALTGERESLKSLGITISQDMVNAQVKLMRSQGQLKGATDEQANAQATMALLYAKSKDAQNAYADGADTVARKTKSFSADLKEFRDQGLGTALQAWHAFSDALADENLGSPLKALTRFMRRNRDAIVSFFLKTGSIAAKVFSIWAKWQSIVLKGLSYLVVGVAKLLDWMSFLDPSLKDAADGADDVAGTLGDLSAKFNEAAKKGGDLSTSLNDQATAAGNAQTRVNALRDAIKQLKNKDVRITVRTTVKDAFAAVDAAVDAAKDAGKTGDTRTPFGAGPSLGAAGLIAAHATFARDIGGHQITSGIRHTNLGSPHSDHARGRAMDITGPRLGSYAQAVRRAGGHAAFHGQGADRHLHVVPVTHRTPTPVAAGGDTLHAEVHFHGQAPSVFDARQAVAGALRDAERRRRERGGR